MTKLYIGLLLIMVLTVKGVSADMDSTQTAQGKNPVNPVRNSSGALNPAVEQRGIISNGVNTVRDLVLSYFYPVSGKIAGIESGLVKVKFQTDKKLKEGMRFSVFREGKPFYHPVTKELVSKSETFVGKVEIKANLSEEIYLCKIIKGTPEEGDIVRITSSRIKLAFFQERKVDWVISEVFYASIKDSRRFEIIESYTKTYGHKELSEIATGRAAEAALLFSTPSKDGTVFLNVKLLWPEDATVLAEIEEPLSPDLLKELKSEEELISIPIAKEAPWISHELASGRLIAIGDVDGNGKKELIVSNGINIRIYDYKEEPKEIWFIKGSPAEEHLSIDVLDVNNNGRAEIFVTSMKGEDTINSYVLEYNPLEGYKKIWEKAPYFFRVMGNTLLMQAFTRSEIYSGPVYEAVWKDGYYQKGKTINLPQGINIYGFTFVDWAKSHLGQNKGQMILTFDDKGYLNLYNIKDDVSGGELIWSSKESYGGFDISFERKTYSVANPVEKWFVKGRLVTVKTKRGQEVIAVKKIPLLATVPGFGYKEAAVYSLWWDGSMMNEELILQNLPGTITDYMVEGDHLFFIARSRLSTFLTKALSGDLAKSSTLLIINRERQQR